MGTIKYLILATGIIINLIAKGIMWRIIGIAIIIGIMFIWTSERRKKPKFAKIRR